MRFNRRRSDRPDSARSRLGSSLEALEGRALLSRNSLGLFSPYAPKDLSVYNPITHQPSPYSVTHQLQYHPGTQNPLLGNEGKIVSGKDRQGNEWTITVHGPGTVIVTDTSPNDGSLDDAIDTIQLVGTDINQTYVTGNVVGSFRVLTNSTMPFNRLIDTQGVRSVILNGFSLAETVAPATGAPNNLNTGIFLTGGVRDLEFHNIEAPINMATMDAPINVVIGDPSTPLTVEPSIKIDSIDNTVFNSMATAPPANVPLTSPTVNITVNGRIRHLELVSTGQNVQGVLASLNADPAGAAAQQFQFPIVGTTGRTSVQAIGINTLVVHGGATNLTASRESQPFQSGFSGLDRVNTALFQGPTDAVGLDVNGPIGQLKFNQGVSNPNNLFLGTTTVTNADGTVSNPEIPATKYGLPAAETSYAGAGYLGGQVSAPPTGVVRALPSNVVTQTPTNPDFGQLLRQGNTTYIVRPGNALTGALITSDTNIGRTTIVGDTVNSEVKGGFNYQSAAVGLQGTRAASQIGPYQQTGNLINGVTSASYRPFMHFYGTFLDTAGPGKIRGNLNGVTVNTQGITPLGNVGTGFYARSKTGYLPPPDAPKRVHGILVK